MISHQTLRRLVYFATIAEVGSLRGAAHRLNLSVPVLSEALSELEAELGVSLATRTTRRFELTQAGIRVQIAAQRILETAETLTDLSATQKPLDGRLGLTVPVEIAEFWLPDKIKAFRAAHPKVLFDIDVTDAIVDLPASPIELAIRTTFVAPGQAPESAVNLPLVVVSRTPVTVAPDGRVDMPLIDSRADRQLSVFSRRDGRELCLKFPQTLRVSNRAAALALARAGVGAVLVMRGSVATELARGTMFEMLNDYEIGSVDLFARLRDRLPGHIARAFTASLGINAK